MAEAWLSIIGLGEDGLAGLSSASRLALSQAEIVFGGPRHLALVGIAGRAWDVPFSVEPVLAERGKRVAILASGDPFWHGVGGSLLAHLRAEEWVSYPAQSTFSLAANRLGWRLEEVICLGLHAAPLTRLRSILARGQKVLCLLRDGAAVGELVAYLMAQGFGASTLHILQCLGGPRERVVKIVPKDVEKAEFYAPVAVAIDCLGDGIPRGCGLPDDLFEHDGQITKRAVRALTLSAIAPRGGDVMWDLGAGSGSVSIEVLLAAPGSVVHAVEADAARGARALRNAQAFGVAHRWHLHLGKALEMLENLPPPDVVFVGGGASDALLRALWTRLAGGVRIVMNAVTLETEGLLYAWHAEMGGQLLRIDLAEAGALGSKRGWDFSRPVVQWSVVK